MKTHSRRIVTAALIVIMAGAGTAFGGEGGQVSAQRARLKAEWAEARAQNSANPDATFVERLLGLDGKDEKVAAAPAKPEPKKN